MKAVESIKPNLENLMNTVTVSLDLPSDLLSAMNIPFRYQCILIC